MFVLRVSALASACNWLVRIAARSFKVILEKYSFDESRVVGAVPWRQKRFRKICVNPDYYQVDAQWVADDVHVRLQLRTVW